MKINIGGQKGRQHFPSGWTIIDVRDGSDICADISQAEWPIASNSVEAIYSSHTLEHIFPHKTKFVLQECHRVLKSGGKIRIVVPDIDIAIRMYYKHNYKFLMHSDNPCKLSYLPDIPIYYLSSWFFTYKTYSDTHISSGGHVQVFNEESLKYYLNAAKFINIQKLEYDKCSPVFNRCDFKRYRHCSLYMEASK